MSTTGFRTLADQLRSWPDERLSRLLHERPDLATPAPHDSGQLASRAATRSSLLRALDQLTRAELCVLDALVVVGQTTEDALAAVVNARPESVGDAVRRLLDLALAWETPQGIRALTAVAELVTVSGLRPFSAEPPDPDDLRARLDELSPAARALLEHVLESGGEATAGTARHTVLPEDAASPAEELLARRLLVPRSGGVVVLPGEVGIALRGGHTTIEPVDEVPGLATSERGQDLVDRAAAGAAFEAVRRVELLLDALGADAAGVAAQRRPRRPRPEGDRRPAARRRADRRPAGRGGLGRRAARDRRRPRRQPGLDPDRRVRPVDAPDRSPSAGPRSSGPGWPAPGWPAWSGRATRRARCGTPSPPSSPAASRSRAGGWRWTRWPGCRPARCWPPAPASRRWCGRVVWLRPRRPRTRADQVAWAVDEAAVLGVIGLGGPASYARALLADDDAAATAALAALLPEPVDHVLLQADLTAVAPGPLESQLARRLQLVADVESRGGATVYRFSPASVRRALDTGWSAAEVHEFIGSVSRTPVPQPLTYLVDDTARTFGSIRVGHAEAFLRADDETALTELLHHPKAGPAGLRRIAPTVLITSTPLDVLLPAAARPRRRAGRRGRRRHRARRPARPAARPHAPRAARRRRTHRPRERPGRARRDRDPGRRPGRAEPARRSPRRRSAPAARWRRCARRSRPGTPC